MIHDDAGRFADRSYRVILLMLRLLLLMLSGWIADGPLDHELLLVWSIEFPRLDFLIVDGSNTAVEEESPSLDAAADKDGENDED